MVNEIEKIVQGLSEGERDNLALITLNHFRGRMMDLLFKIKLYARQSEFELKLMEDFGGPEPSSKRVLDSLKNQYSSARENLVEYGIPTDQFDEVYHNLINGNNVEAETIAGLL